ncbi:hypothetical protein KIL84_019770 [Mauremys mutica]|uniref:Uncharacterized protein n=1 Tax=Mauremys mutica TaxID=74926 RepID=A0A9D4BAL0_9SAUR|nr:hypothetical protein KIL84_019770 [Mauremys mutica]
MDFNLSCIFLYIYVCVYIYNLKTKKPSLHQSCVENMNQLCSPPTLQELAATVVACIDFARGNSDNRVVSPCEEQCVQGCWLEAEMETHLFWAQPPHPLSFIGFKVAEEGCFCFEFWILSFPWQLEVSCTSVWLSSKSVMIKQILRCVEGSFHPISLLCSPQLHIHGKCCLAGLPLFPVQFCFVGQSVGLGWWVKQKALIEHIEDLGPGLRPRYTPLKNMWLIPSSI